MTDTIGEMDPGTLVRMGTIESLNAQDRDTAAKFFTDDLDYYDSSGEHGGFEKLYEDGRDFERAFPDLDADVVDTITDGNEVMFQYTVRGTHMQPIGDLPPTGKAFETQGMGYARVADGRIDEYRLVFDSFGMLQQLDAV